MLIHQETAIQLPTDEEQADLDSRLACQQLAIPEVLGNSLTTPAAEASVRLPPAELLSAEHSVQTVDLPQQLPSVVVDEVRVSFDEQQLKQEQPAEAYAASAAISGDDIAVGIVFDVQEGAGPLETKDAVQNTEVEFQQIELSSARLGCALQDQKREVGGGCSLAGW